MELSKYTEALRPLFMGRKVVCIGATATSFAATASWIRELGAVDLLIVTLAGYGVGPRIPSEVAEVFEVTLPIASTSMETLRQEEAFKLHPSDDLLAALHRFDPERKAMVVGQFVNTASHLDGRPFFSFRRPEWMALEDKTVIDSFWDRAGVARQPSVNCRIDSGLLATASAQVDGGAGVVWSGDSREGFNGGAEYVHLVRTRDEFSFASNFFASRCDQVRLMPFLEGIPCSIHGVVFPDYVAAIRPVEMVVLRRVAPLDGQGVFAYKGCASFYDPPDIIRVQMIDIAKQAGKQLRREVGFRGCFTVDGVVTPNGFYPTELNPRQGAGLSTVMSAQPDIPFPLVIDAVTAGVDLAISPTVFESELRHLADQHRAGGSWGTASARVIATENRPAAFVDGVWRWATQGEPAAGLVSSGPRGGGGFARITFQPGAVPVGPSVGLMAASFWEFASSELDADVGLMAPAKDCFG
jgi:hypothetical protein